MRSREKLTPKPNVGVKKDLGSFQFLAMEKGKLGFRSPLSIMRITTAIAVRKILINQIMIDGVVFVWCISLVSVCFDNL